MKKLFADRPIFTLALLTLGAWALAGSAGAEDVKITAYYPSPDGQYKTLSSTDKTTLATGGLPTSLVGIGTTDPRALLEVAFASNATTPSLNSGILIQNTDQTLNNYSGLFFGISRANVANGLFTAAAIRATAAGFDAFGDLAFSTAAGNVLYERMRIDTSGNVGINTTTPQERLQVDNGNIMVNNTTSSARTVLLGAEDPTEAAMIFLGPAGSSNGMGVKWNGSRLAFQITDNYMGNPSLWTGSSVLTLNPAGDLVNIMPGGGAQVTIGGDGTLYNPGNWEGIVDLAPNGPRAAYQLSAMNGASRYTTGAVRVITMNGYWGTPDIGSSDGEMLVGTETHSRLWFATNSLPRMVITEDGNVGIGTWPQNGYFLEVGGNAFKTTGGDTWNVLSDRSIKTNIQDIPNALDTITKLRPVKFRYTKDHLSAHPEIKDRDYYFYTAQEFQTVFPDSVERSGEKGYLSVNASNVTPFLVKALQEQQTTIENLKTEIEALKKKNA